MFDFKYKKHNNIYNNLVKLSRNIYFYKDIKLEDKLENRIILIFAHLAIILNVLKPYKEHTKFSQELYDNVFLNIENNFRELGHGDVTVNKKMKLLNRTFHDILLKLINKKIDNNVNPEEITKFLYKSSENNEILEKLRVYFKKYQNFCFDIINKNMIKDLDKFEY
jgi:hypothetical protein